MSTLTVKDGTTIYYKDWGKGPVVTFSHGWPLNSDAWDGQMLLLQSELLRYCPWDAELNVRREAGVNEALGLSDRP
jgi:non-heme chloroperoxidase